MPTKIEWAEETWNPITGCTPVSEGCANCYARRMATRLRGRCGYPADDPFRIVYHHKKYGEPLRWKKPRIVFVCSMGDLFHKDVDVRYLAEVFGVMKKAKQHTFLLLTKRPENVPRHESLWDKNVWLGVTAENQQRADERIPILLQIPAAVRFVSVEPMLGRVCLDIHPGPEIGKPTGKGWRPASPGTIDWVICGGESGPGARPMHPDWARSLRDQCQTAGVPFFFKQWGKYCYPDQMPEYTYDAVDVHHNLAGHGDYNKPWGVGKKLAGRLLDDEEWNEMPAAEE